MIRSGMLNWYSSFLDKMFYFWYNATLLPSFPLIQVQGGQAICMLTNSSSQGWLVLLTFSFRVYSLMHLTVYNRSDLDYLDPGWKRKKFFLHPFVQFFHTKYIKINWCRKGIKSLVLAWRLQTTLEVFMGLTRDLNLV